MIEFVNYIAIFIMAGACSVSFLKLEEDEHKFLFIGIAAYLLLLGLLYNT